MTKTPLEVMHEASQSQNTAHFCVMGDQKNSIKSFFYLTITEISQCKKNRFEIESVKGAERLSSKTEGRRFDPSLPHSACQSVLGQDVESQTRFHRESAAHRWMDVCEQGNGKAQL